MCRVTTKLKAVWWARLAICVFKLKKKIKKIKGRSLGVRRNVWHTAYNLSAKVTVKSASVHRGSLIHRDTAEVSCLSVCRPGREGEFNCRRFYSRAEDFFKIEDLLDVVHLLLPRLSSAGVSVLPSHGAASPATSPIDSGGALREDGRMRGRGGGEGKGNLNQK